VRIVFDHFGESGFGRLVGEIDRGTANDVNESGGRIRVDFFPSVGRLVIVGVKSGEKEEDGDALGDIGGVIAGRVATLGDFEFEG